MKKFTSVGRRFSVEWERNNNNLKRGDAKRRQELFGEFILAKNDAISLITNFESKEVVEVSQILDTKS